MEFTVTVEVDWIGEDSNVDETVQASVINGITKQIIASFNDETIKAMTKKAVSIVEAKTELLINSVLEKPVTISTGWQTKVEYESIFDMVEQRMTALYEGKLDASGQCKKDTLLASIENYVKQETTRMLSELEKKIKQISTETARAEINENELIKAIGLVVKK